MSIRKMINVTINGDQTEIGIGCSIELLIQDLKMPKQGIAIALNNTVVPKSEWPLAILNASDKVEILTIAQGG